jgi:hypothetical protein
MGGGRPLEVPLASMGISCRGAVIVRASPRTDKGESLAQVLCSVPAYTNPVGYTGQKDRSCNPVVHKSVIRL